MKVEPPVRASHSYTQHLNAPAVDVFPLLCPVRETEWVDGWSPIVVYSESGVAEDDCVFITPDGDAEATWIIAHYDPKRFQIGFVKVIPKRMVVHIEIGLRDGGDDTCEANVRYTYTALGQQGKRFVNEMTEGEYGAFMRRWEVALNRHLASESANSRRAGA